MAYVKSSNHYTARAIVNGDVATNPGRTFRSDAGEDVRYGMQFGWMSERLCRIIRERRANIDRVVYSYQTPIAWRDSGVWIVPDRRYSSTTGKHVSALWKLQGLSIPDDCGVDEYMRVLSGLMRFEGGRTVPGPNYAGK